MLIANMLVADKANVGQADMSSAAVAENLVRV